MVPYVEIDAFTGATRMRWVATQSTRASGTNLPKYKLGDTIYDSATGTMGVSVTTAFEVPRRGVGYVRPRNAPLNAALEHYMVALVPYRMMGHVVMFHVLGHCDSA